MRYLLGAFIILALVKLLDYSDFFLSRYIRTRIAEINTRADQSFSYKPVSRLNVVVVSLLFWLPPFYIMQELFLEYKIIITVLYWIAVASALYFYIRKQSSKKTARQALPFIVSFAIAAGLFLGPVLSTVNVFLGF